jgi:nitronate monooxygenase
VGGPVLRTVLCDLLGIEYPLLLAGMGPTIGDGPRGVAGPALVAAVSNAGGLGVLGGTGLGPLELESEIAEIRALTDKPFGVDLLVPTIGGEVVEPSKLPDDLRQLLPAESRQAVDALREQLGLPDVRSEGLRLLGFSPREQVEALVALGVPVLATGLGTPAPFVDAFHEAGGKVISLVGTPKAARAVVEDGADIVVAQGHEAGGHTGGVATMALLPQVLDVVGEVPVVAAGGIGDGRGVAAALAMGCAGAWCGTVFIATVEARLDHLRKQRVLAAGPDDTRVTRLYSGKTMRNVDNPLIELWESSGVAALPMGLQSVLVADLLAAARQAGRQDLLMNAAGQITGMLHDVRPAAEVVESMVSEAVMILTESLPARVEARPPGD